MQMTIPLKRWQVRQGSKNDFCGFRCVIRPIQKKMFKLKSFFTLILNSNCIYYNSHLSPYHSSHNTRTGGYCKRKDQYSWLIFILTQNTAVAISPILAAWNALEPNCPFSLIQRRICCGLKWTAKLLLRIDKVKRLYRSSK
jgi:hypothetical protein